MRYLIAIILASMIWPLTAQSIVLIPSDNTAEGGAGDRYFTLTYGVNQSTFPSVGDCLRSGGSNGYLACGAAGDEDARHSHAYFSTVFIESIECAPMEPFSAWHANSFITIAVYESEGDDISLAFDRNQIGGTLTFDNTDDVGRSRRLVINEFTVLTSALLQIAVQAVNLEAATTEVNGIRCTMHGVR